MTTDTIECPFCAEIIKINARKCRYCGEFLTADATRGTILEEYEAKKKAIVQATAVSAPAPLPEPTPAAAQTVEVDTAVIPPTAASEQEKIATALVELYDQLAQMPDSDEKALVIQALRDIESESSRGEEADANNVENLVKNVIKVMPDVAEITINTIINPASGLTSLVQKIAKRVAENYKNKETEKQPESAAAPQTETEAAELDAADASETLTELRDKLADVPGSPEKQLVEETLQKIEEAQTEVTETPAAAEEKAGGVLNAIAKILPGVAEATADIVQQASEAVEESQSS